MSLHPEYLTFSADIPTEAAYNAHRGTSHVPEKRAERERNIYSDMLNADWSALYELAGTEDKRVVLAVEFARYREGYRTRTLAMLAAKSRCMSAMIAGPARFPTARNAKRVNTADNRTRELLEFRERALTAICRTLCPDLAPIMTEDADAGERLAVKVAAAEARRDEMKAANVAARLAGQDAPHASFTLTILGANIRRMKGRVQVVAKVQAAPEVTQQGTAARVEDCPPDNRVRLFFPGKPEESVRAELKRRGFRWTPSLGCWQAYRNTWSLEAAQRIAGLAPVAAQPETGGL